jgi:hypothetical protein
MGGVAKAAEWDSDHILRFLKSISMCHVDEETPVSSIEQPFSITGRMMSAMPKIYRLLPIGSCQFSMDGRKNEKPIEFTMAGTKIQLGELSWQIASDVEDVSTTNYGFKRQFEAPYTDPGFYLSTEYGKTSISMTITRNREIIEFTAVDIGESMVRCDFDQRSQSL